MRLWARLIAALHALQEFPDKHRGTYSQLTSPLSAFIQLMRQPHEIRTSLPLRMGARDHLIPSAPPWRTNAGATTVESNRLPTAWSPREVAAFCVLFFRAFELDARRHTASCPKGSATATRFRCPLTGDGAAPNGGRRYGATYCNPLLTTVHRKASTAWLSPNSPSAFTRKPTGARRRQLRGWVGRCSWAFGRPVML